MLLLEQILLSLLASLHFTKIGVEYISVLGAVSLRLGNSYGLLFAPWYSFFLSANSSLLSAFALIKNFAFQRAIL